MKKTYDPDHRLTGLYEKAVGRQMTIAEMVRKLTADEPPVRFEAYDGSGFGPTDTAVTMRLINERGLRYLATAPGDLGMARAYVVGRPRCSKARTPATRTRRSG